ncbi:MAG: hypothetical protein Q7K43_02185, partial [Candidatus Woesearchaeota archaeon]|nr:hypothetical protein [Candidatus Woesearchaeota archaeon]
KEKEELAGLQTTIKIDSTPADSQERTYHALVTYTLTKDKSTATLTGTSKAHTDAEAQPFEISIFYEQSADKSQSIQATLTGDIAGILPEVFKTSPVKSADGKVHAEVQISPEGKLTVTQLDITTVKTTKITLEESTTLEIGSIQVKKPAETSITATTNEVVVENMHGAELNEVKFTDTTNPTTTVQVKINKIIVQGNARFSLGSDNGLKSETAKPVAQQDVAQNQVLESVLETIRTLFGSSDLSIGTATVTLNPDGTIATVDIVGEGIVGALAINKDLVKGNIHSIQNVHAVLTNGKVSSIILRGANVEGLTIDNTAWQSKGIAQLSSLELHFEQKGSEQTNQLVQLTASGKISGTTKVADNGFVADNLEIANLELS